MMSSLERLGKLGVRYRDPMHDIDWDSAVAASPWLPLNMLSLGGAETKMSQDMLVRLSRIEYARLCAAGLWVEGLLISRISRVGYPAVEFDEARVILNEVREEAGHGLMFLEMIRRADLDRQPLLGATRFLSMVARLLPATSPEFWALVYVGESVTDTFAVKALQRSLENENEICPLARQVLSFHHRDEARHIAAARALLEKRIGGMSAVRKQAFAAGINLLLPRFVDATLYPTPASLAQLGIDDPDGIARAARACPERRKLVLSCSAPSLRFLSGFGLGGLEFMGESTFTARQPDELA